MATGTEIDDFVGPVNRKIAERVTALIPELHSKFKEAETKRIAAEAAVSERIAALENLSRSSREISAQISALAAELSAVTEEVELELVGNAAADAASLGSRLTSRQATLDLLRRTHARLTEKLTPEGNIARLEAGVLLREAEVLSYTRASVLLHFCMIEKMLPAIEAEGQLMILPGSETLAVVGQLQGARYSLRVEAGALADARRAYESSKLKPKGTNYA